tara:strand:+ start:374 stop:730 length:357 start_codon:yes stop_codon:yes gene_type:complete
MSKCYNCDYDNQTLLDQRQKIIQNVVRVSSSEYSMNLASNIVYDNTGVNKMADRTATSGTSQEIKKKGVSVKHDSYARYLAKKKGRAVLKGEDPNKTRQTAEKGGKNYKFSIINNCTC